MTPVKPPVKPYKIVGVGRGQYKILHRASGKEVGRVCRDPRLHRAIWVAYLWAASPQSDIGMRESRSEAAAA